MFSITRGTAFVRLAVMAAIAAIGVGAAAAQTPAAKAGQPSLRAVCSLAGPTPTVRVTIANPGTADLSILLGYTPGTPQPQVATAFLVSAIRAATGASEEYPYIHPKYALYAGKMDPWIVVLKPGASTSVDLALKDFISGLNYSSLEPTVAAGARLVLEGKALAKQPGKLWTGRVDSAFENCAI